MKNNYNFFQLDLCLDEGMRAKMQKSLNGILIINKQKGYTSHDVIAKLRKILNTKKIGHTGTLDPNATGVLPILINQGTKLSAYLMEHDKEYEVTLKLGIRTDTFDEEGKILEKVNVDFNKLEPVEKVLESFIGRQSQIPPMYSAIKVNGKKLYEYARSGKKVEIEPRNIEIYGIKLQRINTNENEIHFMVKCSKGTYIRSLCVDIAKKLGTIGYMKELNRTKVGNFFIENSVTLEKLENNYETLEKNIITFQRFFEKRPNIYLTNSELSKFLNGVKINKVYENGIYNIYKNKEYIGIGKIEGNMLKREIVIIKNEFKNL